MKKFGGLFLGLTALLGFLFSGACAPLPPSGEVPCQPQKAYSGAPVWEDLVKDAQQVKSLSAKVEITYSQGATGKIKGILIFQPPDSLRFEALSPWGQPGAYLIIKDQQLSYFTLGDNRLLLGSAQGRWLKDFLGMELPPVWLFSLLNGRGWPVQGHPRFMGMKETKEGREFYLHYPQEAFQEVVFWDGPSGEVKEVVFHSLEDGLEVRAKLEDFLCSGNLNFPQRIALHSPAGWQAQITFSQLQVNHPLEPSLFETPPPQEGMKVYYLN